MRKSSIFHKTISEKVLPFGRAGQGVIWSKIRYPTFQKVINGPETRFHPCGDEPNIRLFPSLFHDAKSNKLN
jgi:hypothetical protein